MRLLGDIHECSMLIAISVLQGHSLLAVSVPKALGCVELAFLAGIDLEENTPDDVFWFSSKEGVALARTDL
jgi:hypothetical protein